METGVKSISGVTEIKVNEWETYTITEWYLDTPLEECNEADIKWAIYYLGDNGPEKILEKSEGKIRFQEPAIGKNYLIVAYVTEPNLSSGLQITVIPSEKKEITSIKISSTSKKIAYGSTLDVVVQTTGMQDDYLELTLYEDDANGAGHNSINDKNLLNTKTVQVGSEGVAKTEFLLEPDFQKIANAYNKSEGSQHEFYVAAYHLGSLKAASDNVNVANPAHVDIRKKETTEVIKGNKPKPETKAPPYKAKAGTTKPTAASGISKVTLVKNGSKKLLATIYSTGLVGKTIRFKLFEDDYIDNDPLVNKDFSIKSDTYKIDIFLDKIPQSKGGDKWEEGNYQELFLDVEVLETKKHIISKTIDVNISEFKIEVADNKTESNIGKGENPEKNDKECFCKKEENQFYWSNNLTCDQRKKVLQVAAELWGESKKKEKASELMSIFHLETAGTFKASADNGKGYSGLLQFSDDVAKGLGTTRSKLKAMTITEQMDYVKKYLEKNKDKLATLTDFYLQVIKPNAVGNGGNPNYILFDESITVPDGDGSKTSQAQRLKNIQREPWVTKYGYASNPTFMLEKDENKKRRKWVYTRQKYEERYGFINGKTTIKEITEVVKKEHYDKGKPNIFFGKCENIKEEKGVETKRAPWVDIAFEEFNKFKGKTEVDSPLKERVAEYFKLSGFSSLKHTDPWCATFIFWCFQHTKEYKDTNVKGNIGAYDWASEDNAKIKGNASKDGWILGEKSEVFVGSIIVFSYSHVAIIVGENNDGKKYVYLGGNQGSNKTGGQKICLGSVSKTSKDIFMIMKPKKYKPDADEKKLPKYDVESENSGSSSR